MKASISLLVTAASTVWLSACSTTPPSNDQLERARNELSQVERSPQAGTAAPDITAARDAIGQASAALESGKDQEAQDLSYIALRRVQIAQQKILTAEANERVQKAQQERQQVLLQARERESAQAQQRASQLQSELAALKARKTDRGIVFTLQDVLFETGQSTLKPGAMQTLDRIAGVLERAPEQEVTIEGYTDSVGSEEYNQSLSERRAEAVRRALVSRGVASEKIRAVGRGESLPVADNNSAAGRQQNRRVEIVVAGNTQSPSSETPSTDSSAATESPVR